MGYKIDFKVDKELIDDNWFTPIYSEEIHVSGNGIVDVVYFRQNENCIGFQLNQFLDMMEQLRHTSLWCEIEQHFKYRDAAAQETQD